MRLVPAIRDSVGATELAASEAALDARLTQVPLEHTCPELQSASFSQEAASAAALAKSAAPSVTAEIDFQFIRPSLSARGSRPTPNK